MKGWILTFSPSHFHILVILPVDGTGLGKQFYAKLFLSRGILHCWQLTEEYCITLLIIERKASTNKSGIAISYVVQLGESGPCIRQTLSCQYHGHLTWVIFKLTFSTAYGSSENEPRPEDRIISFRSCSGHSLFSTRSLLLPLILER
jgi:hypothetical protein